MFHRILLSAYLIIVTSISVQAQPELSPREIAKRSLSSVGLIMCVDGRNVSLGSGFFIEPGILVTNYHVIEGKSRGVVQVAFGEPQEKRVFRIARVIGYDKDADLAILSVPAARVAGVPALAMASETYQIEIGETVYALGNPEGLVGTMSPGIVSASLRSSAKKTRIQITAPISRGSSGGPIVNGLGNIIGIAVSTLSEGQNLNFAVPIGLLHALIDSAKFPNERQDALDTVSDKNSTIPKPWASLGLGGPARKGSSSTADPSLFTATDYFLRGEKNFMEVKIEAAIADYSKAIELNPKLYLAYLKRGVMFEILNRNDLAVADYTKAIQLDPRDVRGYHNRGSVYANQGRFGLSIADYEKAIQINSQDADAYNGRGAVYVKAKRPEMAIADFTKATQINPLLAGAYINRGEVYEKQGSASLALADYTKAIQVDPQDSGHYTKRAKLFEKLEKYDLAMADFSKAIEINPLDVLAYWGRADRFIEQNMWQRAIADYSKVIELIPEFATSAFTGRAMAYASLGKVSLAISDLTKAIAIGSDNVKAYFLRAFLYFKEGKVDLAIADYSKVIEINPQFAAAYDFRAQMYCAKGQLDLAQRDETRVLDLGGKLGQKCK